MQLQLYGFIQSMHRFLVTKKCNCSYMVSSRVCITVVTFKIILLCVDLVTHESPTVRFPNKVERNNQLAANAL